MRIDNTTLLLFLIGTCFFLTLPLQSWDALVMHAECLDCIQTSAPKKQMTLASVAMHPVSVVNLTVILRPLSPILRRCYSLIALPVVTDVAEHDML